jgi:hypothetical protein
VVKGRFLFLEERPGLVSRALRRNNLFRLFHCHWFDWRVGRRGKEELFLTQAEKVVGIVK